MADERIIELDTANEVLDDDYLAIDSVSGETRKIKPIKIGATYEIEDGDHEFTLVGSNGYEHTVEIPSDSVSMTQAEYNALTPAQKADGTARFLTDAESDVESELWSKVGRQTLDTEAQVLSNAVNELKGDIDTNTDDIFQLNSNIGDWKNITFSGTYSGELGGVYNDKLKLAIVNYNSKTANADYTATMNVTAKKGQFGAIRGGGYLQVNGTSSTISITNSAQWSVGQIIFTIL